MWSSLHSEQKNPKSNDEIIVYIMKPFILVLYTPECGTHVIVVRNPHFKRLCKAIFWISVKDISTGEYVLVLTTIPPNHPRFARTVPGFDVNPGISKFRPLVEPSGGTSITCLAAYTSAGTSNTCPVACVGSRTHTHLCVYVRGRRR